MAFMYQQRDQTDYIVVHCSATKPSADIGEDEIRKWHVARRWADIGYNIVIRRSGRIEIGRPLDYRGAHVEGHNHDSIGVCLVGGLDDDGKPAPTFTDAQWESLKLALRFCKNVWPNAVIQGHRDFPNVHKECPCFDVKSWVTANL
jgi:hypothetical protein